MVEVRVPDFDGTGYSNATSQFLNTISGQYLVPLGGATLTNESGVKIKQALNITAGDQKTATNHSFQPVQLFISD